MDTTDHIIKMVNEHSDMVIIAEYILKLTNDYFYFDEAKKIATFLVKEKQYNKNDILNGLANNDIFLIAKSKRIRENSVKNKSETSKKVPFKTIKKPVAPKVIASSLALIILISYLYAINNKIDNYREDMQVSNLIGMAVSDQNEKTNIVSKNSYAIGHGDKRAVAYNNVGIASDIIKVCVKNPELLDLVLYRTYFDMGYNRLANMDVVISNLASSAKLDESLAFITDSLGNCSSFLDYVFKKGYISANDDDYYMYQDAVMTYNDAVSNSKCPYNDLPENIKKTIDKLMDEYKKGKENLYSEYKDDLSELLEPNEGFNEGGRK